MTKEQALNLSPGTKLRVISDRHSPKKYFAKGCIIETSYNPGYPGELNFNTNDNGHWHSSLFEDFEIICTCANPNNCSCLGMILYG